MVKMLRAGLLAVWGLLLAMPLAADVERIAPLRVVASIKPLQLIVQAVTDGVTEAVALLPPGASPHDYALKPSDLMRVYEADLVVWLGGQYEPYLEKALALHPVDELTVTTAESIEAEALTGEHDEGAHALQRDPHVWLSPEQALRIAEQLADLLIEKDGENAAQYQTNLERFREQLAVTERAIATQLKSKNLPGYLVYHDAFSHFEGHFGLTHAGVVSENPEAKPGVKRLLKLRRLISDGTVKCLFTEPQTDPDMVGVLAGKHPLQVYALDPMANDIPGSGQGYVTFLQYIGDQFSKCSPEA